MISFALAVALLQTPVITAGRFEMAERLKILDSAWLDCKEVSRRRDAVKEISAAVFGFFGGKASDTCRSLDKAIALLEDRAVRPGDAVTIRFADPIVEPGAVARLLATWAYLPVGEVEQAIEVGGKSVTAKPGSNAEIEVEPNKLNPELGRAVEAGYLVPVRVGGISRGAYLSIIKGAPARIKRMQAAKNPTARDLGELLSIYSASPGRMETEMPLIQYLFTAEQLEDGQTKLENLDHIPYAKQGSTVFRAMLPKTLSGKMGARVTVVIALHGAGGSENMFFESYGRGIAAKQALRRNWVFIAPRTGASAITDCLQWLREVRKLNVERYFVIGHSMGGGVAFSAGKLSPKPAAIALMAPAAGSASKSLLDLPIFLAVGKQEMGSIRQGIQGLSREWATRKNFEYKEYDPCEHLMVVAEAIPDAFAFLDRYAK